eukprot:3561-Heterococcus_DN1.PRE.1
MLSAYKLLRAHRQPTDTTSFRIPHFATFCNVHRLRGLHGASKEDTAAVATLLKSKEACSDLTSVVLISNESSATAAGAALGRKRNSISATSRATTAVKPVKKPQRGAQPAHLKDATGEVGLYDALCTALPKLAALHHLELQGLKRAFGKGGAHGLKLSRALKPPSTAVATAAATARAATDTITGGSKSSSTAAVAVLQLKSLVLRNVALTDAKAVTALCCAVAASGITALSLVNCGLREGVSAQMIGMIIRAHSN